MSEGEKEPEFIEALLHSEECGRSILYDVYENEVCSIAEIVNHIDTLSTRLAAAERDGERLEWIESRNVLGNSIEILFGFNDITVDQMTHDGATCYATHSGKTLREALDAARATGGETQEKETEQRCESGDPACGPVEHWDSDGVPLCAVCWQGLLDDYRSATGGEPRA